MVQELDGTTNEWGWCKQKVLRVFALLCLNKLTLFLQLGANAILAVSLAVCKAGAAVKKTPLYQVETSFIG